MRKADAYLGPPENPPERKKLYGIVDSTSARTCHDRTSACLTSINLP